MESLFAKNSTYTYVIGEIGGNFTTYEDTVKFMDAAKYSGVDCIKLQTYRAETLSAKSAMFDMENTKKSSQYDYFLKYMNYQKNIVVIFSIMLSLKA